MFIGLHLCQGFRNERRAMFHALISNIRRAHSRSAGRPFATAAVLGLIMLIAAAGPWACIVHCAAPAGAHHARHHAPHHVLTAGTGDRATGPASESHVRAHEGHHPAAHLTAGDTGSHATVSALGEHAETGILTHAAGIPDPDDSGTDHALHCPPGPSLTALTFAIILPGAPHFRMVVLRLQSAIPLRDYTSVASHPPAPPPRASNSVAI